jgi:hypothetical protein
LEDVTINPIGHSSLAILCCWHKLGSLLPDSSLGTAAGDGFGILDVDKILKSLESLFSISTSAIPNKAKEPGDKGKPRTGSIVEGELPAHPSSELSGPAGH